MRRILLSLPFLLLLLAPVANAAVIEIGAPTVPTVLIDFDLMAAGAVTVADINTAFPGAGILSLTFTESGEAETTFYDRNTFPGRALKPDASGAPILVDPLSDTAGEAIALSIVLDRTITQFGFSLADRVSTIDLISLCDGVTPVGTFSTLAPDGTIHYLASTVPFDRFVISELDDWVIPEIVLQVAVPEPSSLALFAAGMLSLAGFGSRRQQRHLH